MGTAQVGGRPVDLLFYDYTVYAGTQSANNHTKISRMFGHARQHRLPVVCWLDGGGARPHDMKVDGRTVSVPATGSPVGFMLVPGSHATLPSGKQPQCT